MNSKQAKNLDMPDLLSRLGYEPVKITKGNTQYWYNSPFREEKNPSLQVSRGERWNWVWNDHGDVKDGTVPDFIMQLEKCTFKEALQYLDALYDGLHIGSPTTNEVEQSIHYPNSDLKTASIPSHLVFIKAQQILHPNIIRYLGKRNIPIAVARRCLREVHYRHTSSNKKHFAFGMKNQSGGYEIRSASDQFVFKSALIARDITLINGQQEEITTLNVFEGMLDYISLLLLLDVPQLAGDSLVMHSLSSFRRSIATIETAGYRKINLFLDNDRAGEEYTQQFITRIGEKVISQSHLFQPYKDLNDAWRAQQK